ncbi:EamA family transporter [Bacillus pseudomycoides]|uniref:DMT family transporter n=1 Tax=Bacillus pseudomycoides TaxID=64104 RepID=UPI000BF7885B|nr:DMT family transporter [Bacillus pseudomycoides]PFZ10480.1 EamA family transporter [Bacillus pseudomycoides]
MKKDKFMLGSIMCLVAVLSWGGMFPMMGGALKVMDPFYFTALRYVTATVVFIILLIAIEGKKFISPEGKSGKLLFFGTMGFAGFSFLVFLGQKLAGLSGAVVASIMMAVQPLLGVLVNWLVKRIKPRKLTLVYMFTALIGVILVITKGNLSVLFSKDTNLFADLLILIGALCWVIYTMGGSYFSGWSPLRYTTLTSFFGSISIVVIVGLATAFGWLKIPTIEMIYDVSGALFYMIFIAGVLAVFCWNLGNKTITPINGILFMNMVPITTFIISIINGYNMSTVELLGALITIFSLIANNIYLRKQAKSAALKAA